MSPDVKAAKDDRLAWGRSLRGHRLLAPCCDVRHAARQQDSSVSAYRCCWRCLRLSTYDGAGGHRDDHGVGAGRCPWWICSRCPGVRYLQRELPQSNRSVVPRGGACRLPQASAPGLALEPCVMHLRPCPCWRMSTRCAGWIPSCPGSRQSCGCGHRCSCVRCASPCRTGLGRIRAGNDRMTGCRSRPCRFRCRCGCRHCRDENDCLPRYDPPKRRVCGCLRNCARCSCGGSRFEKRDGVPSLCRPLRPRFPHHQTTRTGARKGRRPSPWKFPWKPGRWSVHATGPGWHGRCD